MIQKKSILYPWQKLKFLGIEINSEINTGSVIGKDSIKQVSLTSTDCVLRRKNCVSVRNKIKYEIKNCINFGC